MRFPYLYWLPKVRRYTLHASCSRIFGTSHLLQQPEGVSLRGKSIRDPVNHRHGGETSPQPKVYPSQQLVGAVSFRGLEELICKLIENVPKYPEEFDFFVSPFLRLSQLSRLTSRYP